MERILWHGNTMVARDESSKEIARTLYEKPEENQYTKEQKLFTATASDSSTGHHVLFLDWPQPNCA